MIRISEEKDVDRIVQIWLNASILAHDFIPSSYWKERIEDMKSVYLPASETFVYEECACIEGFISMMDNHIAAIFVNPEKQGLGIGKALINYVKRSYPVLTLSVYSKNAGSVQFYQKLGFIISGENVEENTGEMELYMELFHS